MPAPEKQTTLPGVPELPPESETDRACRAVREFQAGRATTAFVRSSLEKLSPNALLVVSIGTRVPLKQLEALKRGE